ncbi:hypothetical protein KFK09_022485 [Dendrobium nobile]|uniref:Uncharacterized protein n=1 Tax=Dendrobium nobile TaxID=94219 RepID=A0A8T3AJA5_DENNO|nr:hypothetical protein KFK09_022485 [Dendrobium nobile]
MGLRVYDCLWISALDERRSGRIREVAMMGALSQMARGSADWWRFGGFGLMEGGKLQEVELSVKARSRAGGKQLDQKQQRE